MMRKIFFVLVMMYFVLCLHNNIGHAKEIPMIQRTTVVTKVVCVEGYKWLITEAVASNGVSVDAEQMYKKFNNWDTPPQPIECGKKK